MERKWKGNGNGMERKWKGSGKERNKNNGIHLPTKMGSQNGFDPQPHLLSLHRGLQNAMGGEKSEASGGRFVRWPRRRCARPVAGRMPRMDWCGSTRSTRQREAGSGAGRGRGDTWGWRFACKARQNRVGKEKGAQCVAVFLVSSKVDGAGRRLLLIIAQCHLLKGHL